MAQRFIRRPATVEAIQWTGDNYEEIREWSWDGRCNLVALLDDEPGTLMVYISVEDQWVRVRKGWWVIRGVLGECYPCANDVFIHSWEEMPEESSVE